MAKRDSVGKKRIVFVGASYKFVHKVLRDMLLWGGFEETQLVVHDLDEVPMQIVADLLRRISKQQGANNEVLQTTNLDEALEGADCVVLSITTGGEEADSRAAEVCYKYGIHVGIGDTMGPAAFARNIRTIPVIVDLVKKMEKLCPNAVMLNFSNPMPVITGAMARETSIPCWGLCHSVDDLTSYFSKIFGVQQEEVEIEAAGVNHQSFVTSLKIKGEDRMSEILERSLAGDDAIVDSLTGNREEVYLQQEVYKVLGYWPSTGGTHLAEFYEYFYSERRLDFLNFRQEKRRPIRPGRERLGRKGCPDIIHKWTYGEDPVEDLDLLTTEHAHELMWSFFTGEPWTRSLNIINSEGFIEGISKDACVEVIATVRGNKVEGKPLKLPPVLHSLIERWTTIHDLTIKSAMNCDKQLAKQALFLDPHVGDMWDIPLIVDDLVLALEPWLPEAWK